MGLLASVRDTSLLAWLNLQPELGAKQALVYAALKVGGPMTNMELSVALGWSINRVTPRVLELRHEGLVVLESERPCKITGRTAYAWKAR
jgi:hypothetical protein